MRGTAPLGLTRGGEAQTPGVRAMPVRGGGVSEKEHGCSFESVTVREGHGLL